MWFGLGWEALAGSMWLVWFEVGGILGPFSEYIIKYSIYIVCYSVNMQNIGIHNTFKFSTNHTVRHVLQT